MTDVAEWFRQMMGLLENMGLSSSRRDRGAETRNLLDALQVATRAGETEIAAGLRTKIGALLAEAEESSVVPRVVLDAVDAAVGAVVGERTLGGQPDADAPDPEGVYVDPDGAIRVVDAHGVVVTVDAADRLPVCTVCEKPAVWMRCTQFAGDHPYCYAHARAERDFDVSDSTKDWVRAQVWQSTRDARALASRLSAPQCTALHVLAVQGRWGRGHVRDATTRVLKNHKLVAHDCSLTPFGRQVLKYVEVPARAAEILKDRLELS